MARASSRGLNRTSRIILAIGFMLVGSSANALDAQRPSPEWTEARRSSDIVIFYRDDQALRAREIVAISEGDGSPEEFFDALRAPGVMPYVRESRILETVNATEAISYVRVNAPLISDRDSVLRVQSLRGSVANGGVFRSFWTTVAGHEGTHANVVRMELNRGSWTLEPLDGGRRTRLTYRIIADPGGSIPRWLAASSSLKTAPAMLDSLKHEVSRHHVTRLATSG